MTRETLGAVTGAAGQAGKAAVSMGFENDPEYLFKSLAEGLRKRGLGEVEISERLNKFQAWMASIEDITKGFNQFGLDIAKQRQELYNQTLQLYLNGSKEQIAKASETLLTLSRDFNSKFLESEQVKLDAKISPYRVQGGLAGFMLAAGEIVNMFKPGAGDGLISRANTMINNMQSNIDGVKLSAPDADMFNKSYEQVTQYVRDLNIDLSQKTKAVADKFGDKVERNGAGMPESTGRIRDRAEDAGNGKSPTEGAGVKPSSQEANPYALPKGGAAGKGAAVTPSSAASNPYAVAKPMTPEQAEVYATERLKTIQKNANLTDDAIKKLSAGYVLANTDNKPGLTPTESVKFKKVMDGMDAKSQEVVLKALEAPAAAALGVSTPKAVSAGIAGTSNELQMALERIGLNSKQASSIVVEAVSADKAVGSSAGKPGALLDSQAEIDKLHKSQAYKLLTPDMQKAIDENFKAPAPVGP